jgi:hypothetical protein
MIKIRVMMKMSPAGDSKSRLPEMFATVSRALKHVCVPGLEYFQGD